MTVELHELDAFELNARVAKLGQIAARQAEDPSRQAELIEIGADRAVRRDEVLVALRDFLSDHDGVAFRAFTERWSRLPGYDGFRGMNGQGFLNQLIKGRVPGRTEQLLAEVLRAPVDDDRARRQMELLIEHIGELGAARPPAPGRVPFLLSFFWSLQDPVRWPVLWTSARNAFVDLGWFSTAGLVDRYFEYAETVRAAEDPAAMDMALLWFKDAKFVGFGPHLTERCKKSAELAELVGEGGYPSDEIERAAERNTRALSDELRLAVEALGDRIEHALGRPVQLRAGTRKSGPVLHRWWAVSSWKLIDGRPSIRIAATVDGIIIGLYPGADDGTWELDPVAIAEEGRPDGLEFFQIGTEDDNGRYLSTGEGAPGPEYLLGRLLPGDQALDRVDVIDDVVAIVEQLKPVVDALAPPLDAEAPEAEAKGSGGLDDPSGFDPVPGLAKDLFLPPDYLEEVIELLHRKKQLIFYGPPGTGKTFVAKAIAEALSDDPNRRTIVQLHPSTSYEDFFEGYRPETTSDGQLSYRLVPGPLARMARSAAESPGVAHVMVIDEINRANLPKVFGELLFLLEYRDTEVRTLYRPDEPFSLPENLFIIGTMNTADRSVALIDAAMRRRFHFLPFFPHEEPHSEVLGAWLDERNPKMRWVADLVALANERLVEDVGGRHLQIGHSHFMQADLDEKGLKAIWSYSVMPFIEELLWGRDSAISAYEYETIRAAFDGRGDAGHLGEPELGSAEDG